MQHPSSKPSVQLSPSLQKVVQGWDAARDGCSVPFRHALDPRNFGSLLDYIFILEQRSEYDFRVRLCGQKICDQVGMELRGMPGVSLMIPENRQEMTALFLAVLDGSDLVKLNVKGTGLGMEGEMLLLPMRGPDGHVNRILGALDAPTPICPPNRFEILAIAAVSEADHLTGQRASEHHKPFDVINGGQKTTTSSPRPNLKLVS